MEQEQHQQPTNPIPAKTSGSNPHLPERGVDLDLAPLSARAALETLRRIAGRSSTFPDDGTIEQCVDLGYLEKAPLEVAVVGRDAEIRARAAQAELERVRLAIYKGHEELKTLDRSVSSVFHNLSVFFGGGTELEERRKALQDKLVIHKEAKQHLEEVERLSSEEAQKLLSYTYVNESYVRVTNAGVRVIEDLAPAARS